MKKLFLLLLIFATQAVHAVEKVPLILWETALLKFKEGSLNPNFLADSIFTPDGVEITTEHSFIFLLDRMYAIKEQTPDALIKGFYAHDSEKVNNHNSCWHESRVLIKMPRPNTIKDVITEIERCGGIRTPLPKELVGQFQTRWKLGETRFADPKQENLSSIRENLCNNTDIFKIFTLISSKKGFAIRELCDIVGEYTCLPGTSKKQIDQIFNHIFINFIHNDSHEHFRRGKHHLIKGDDRQVILRFAQMPQILKTNLSIDT